jgi:hypothetical protein
MVSVVAVLANPGMRTPGALSVNRHRSLLSAIASKGSAIDRTLDEPVRSPPCYSLQRAALTSFTAMVIHAR